jgi:magnesium transporter
MLFVMNIHLRDAQHITGALNSGDREAWVIGHRRARGGDIWDSSRTAAILGPCHPSGGLHYSRNMQCVFLGRPRAMLTYFQCVNGRIEKRPFSPELFGESPETLHWLDLESPTPEETAVLERPFGFHPLAIEDCLSEINHPKIDDYESYLFIIVHGIHRDAPEELLVTRELDTFLGPNFLVTYHRGPMRSISHARELCEKCLMATMPKGVDFLLHQILDQLFEHFMPVLDAIEDHIQLTQVQVFENPTRETLDSIFRLKNQVLHLRRTCTPQRDILSRLARTEFSVVSRKAAFYFRDVYDHVYRIVEVAYSYQDLVQSTLDAYLSAVNNRLNETMKRLTVIGALLMPLTVITSLYGMNFKFMPELEWRYGYPLVLGLMATVSLGLVYWFKKKQWI